MILTKATDQRDETLHRYGQKVEQSSKDRLVLPAKWLNNNNTSVTEIVHGGE